MTDMRQKLVVVIMVQYISLCVLQFFLLSCIPPVLHLSCHTSLLSCIPTVLHPSCNASLLSCIPTVLHPSCHASLLSCIPTVLHPSCHASFLSCIPPVLCSSFPAFQVTDTNIYFDQYSQLNIATDTVHFVPCRILTIRKHYYLVHFGFLYCGWLRQIQLIMSRD